MRFAINDLFMQANETIHRILWMTPNRQAIVAIEVKNPRALPYWLEQTQLDRMTVQWIPDNTAPSPSYLADIPEPHRQQRDAAWQLIQCLVENVPAIFNRESRGQQIKAVIEQTGSTKTTLYRYLRRYWQGGQTRNTLLPQYTNCGALGKERPVTTVKRGVPSNLTRLSGNVTGVNIDAAMRAIFRRGIRLFHEQQKHSLRDTYQLTLEKYFNQGYEWQHEVAVPLLPSASELPTFGQFYYWYRKEQHLAESLSKREGERRYNTRYRPVLGNSTQMAFGPGSLYQIDATQGDIYLVSSLDPQRIIGKPTLYLVVDVFSHLITGMYVGLENPSWLGAMLALENATTTKVAFCQQYDITIEEAEWPSHYLPEGLLADRGELESYHANNLVAALNIQVMNTAPYRADMKGMVEQLFRLNNQTVVSTLPGAVRSEQQRGDKDYRLEAALTIRQFTHLIIQGILYHNRARWLKDYPLTPAMIADGVEPYPLTLWEWGIHNVSGHLRTLPQEVIRLNLLPRGQASVTRQGIYFKGLYYSCERAVTENWFTQAGLRGRWTVDAAYDPRTTARIYLQLKTGQFEPCYLLDNLQMQAFQGQDWLTTEDYFRQRTMKRSTAASRQQQAKAELNAHKQHMVEQAVEWKAQTTTPTSKRGRIQDIRANRELERQAQREQTSWQIGEQSHRPDEEDAYVPPPDYLDKLQGTGRE